MYVCMYFSISSKLYAPLVSQICKTMIITVIVIALLDRNERVNTWNFPV